MFRIDVNSSTWCYWKQYLSLHYAHFIQCGLKINVKNNKKKQYINTIRIEYKIKKNEIYKHRTKWYLYLQSQCIARKRGWAFLRMSQVLQVYLVFFFLCSIIRYLRELFVYLVLIELLTITVLVSFHHCNM
jgi:hypothetical protein